MALTLRLFTLAMLVVAASPARATAPQARGTALELDEAGEAALHEGRAHVHVVRARGRGLLRREGARARIRASARQQGPYASLQAACEGCQRSGDDGDDDDGDGLWRGVSERDAVLVC